MTEPMGDAEVDRLRATANAKWIDRGGMWMRPIDVLDLIARLDAERSRADAAEAARDAAISNALPAPVLMETVEQVEALADGFYRVALGTRWTFFERFQGGWFLVDSFVERPSSDMVGVWLQALPDLPIPTPTQEG